MAPPSNLPVSVNLPMPENPGRCRVCVGPDAYAFRSPTVLQYARSLVCKRPRARVGGDLFGNDLLFLTQCVLLLRSLTFELGLPLWVSGFRGL